MYMLSGILLDIRKKEEMRGGERITLLGKITLDGEEITSLPPHERAARGIILCPERRRIFGESRSSRTCGSAPISLPGKTAPGTSNTSSASSRA